MGKITGFDAASSVNRIMQQAVIPGVNDTAQAVAAYARGVTPVLTGQLQAGWYVVLAQLISAVHVRASVRNDVSYGPFVDKGTSRMAPRNMSGQAMDAEGKNLDANIRKYL
jgi:hypothetical protein